MSIINQNWDFQKLPQENIRDISDISSLLLGEDLFKPVHLPHTWYADGEAYKGTVIYRKKLYIEAEKDKRFFLNFQAADRWCKVFVNKRYVGEHKGGYSAFTFDISEYCLLNSENEIIVLLDNRSGDEISPLAGDFTVFGGLTRDVHLLVTPQIYFDRTYYGTNGVIVNTKLQENGQGMIIIEPHISGMKGNENIRLEYQIFSPEQQLVYCATGTLAGTNHIMLDNPLLWNGMKNPALYRLQASLKADEETIDSVEVVFGFRNIHLDAQEGFFLNGNHMKLNGVAKHQDYGDVFSAVGLEHWQQDMDDIVEIGANSVRLSHYQHPQEMYQLCDEKGMIVWAEIPLLQMTGNPGVLENAGSQLKELILQNLHHPSICFWGIQNEVAMFGENPLMYEQLGQLARLTRELDSTRICAGANLFCVENSSPLNKVTEAVGYNIYFGWYYGEMEDSQVFVEKFHQDNPDIPLGITEYGVDCNLAFHSDEPQVKDYTEEYQALYHETVYPLFRDKEYIWGTYVWNLYDFSSEIREEGGVKYKNCKGLISYDRRIKKDAYYYYKAQWSLEPFVKIAESRFVNREKPVISVKVYSNQPEVILTVNEDCYQACPDNGIFLYENVRLKKGQNVLKAFSGEMADEIILWGVEEADVSYRYVDPNPGLNVKNWFIDAVEEEKMFPKGRLSIRESCKEILASEQAMAVIEAFSADLAREIRERQGFMPLERLLSYMKKEITEARCKELNDELTKIVKTIS